MILKSRPQTETWENLYSPALFKRMMSSVDTHSQSWEKFIIRHSCHSSITCSLLPMCEITFINPLYKNVAQVPANRPAFLHTEVCGHTSRCLIKAYDEIQNVARNKHWEENPASCSGSGSPRGSRYRSVSSMKNTWAGGIWYSTAGEGREPGPMEGNPQEGFWCSVAWQ